MSWLVRLYGYSWMQPLCLTVLNLWLIGATSSNLLLKQNRSLNCNNNIQPEELHYTALPMNNHHRKTQW